MRDVRATITLGLVLLCGLAVLVQASPVRGISISGSGRILLATVVDISGKTQVDFGVDDFLIQEAGDEREVLDVHVADYPIVVLIDDAPQSSDLGPIKSAIARFIARVGERPVAVGTLSKPVRARRLSGRRSRSRARASREYEREAWQAVDAPGRRSRRAACFKTRARRFLQSSSSPAARSTQESLSRATCCRQSPRAAPRCMWSRVKRPSWMQRTPSEAMRCRICLRVLADQTHGQYTTIFSSASYSTALDRLADKLSAELMIQYLVPAGEVGGRCSSRRPTTGIASGGAGREVVRTA